MYPTEMGVTRKDLDPRFASEYRLLTNFQEYSSDGETLTQDDFCKAMLAATMAPLKAPALARLKATMRRASIRRPSMMRRGSIRQSISNVGSAIRRASLGGQPPPMPSPWAAENGVVTC